MNELLIKELKTIKSLTLHKLNEEIIAQIPLFYIVSESKNFDDIDYIQIKVPMHYISNFGKNKKEYHVYDYLIPERLLCVDGDFFIIKEVTEDKNKFIKTIKAYGYEKKMEKNNVVLSNCGLTLMDSDETNDIYSFDDYMYKEIGWHIGHIDDTVRFMENGEPKVRMQEDTDTSFYSFITETIAEQFCCVPIFDRKNKLINLYDIDSFGDEVKLVLSKDNYLKSLEKTSNSSDIITRLILKGNEEKCIVEKANPTGLNYIENYSYFIENNEMSKELIRALKQFEILTKERMEEWNELVELKAEKEWQLSDLDSSENLILNKIEQLKNIINGYNDLASDTEYFELDSIKEQLESLQQDQQTLNEQITTFENEISELNARIERLNILCRRETSEDANGNLLFTKEMLEELKKFVYYDTYSDDSFIDANEIIKTGKRQLELRCRPTIEFSINSVNFTERILTNKNRQHTKCKLGLGDVIALYDRKTKKEELVYFVGWEKNYKDKSLTLNFSNKKTNKENTRTIADLLKKSKDNKKIISLYKWLWNKNKYNSVETDLVSNVDFDLNFNPNLVKDTRVSGVSISPTSIKLDIDETYTLKATVEPDTAQNKNILWISSDDTVATVDNGIVKALKYGGCVISAITEEGNYVANCSVIVREDINEDSILPTGIELIDNLIELNKDGESYIIPKLNPSNANQNVTYISSNNSIATVDNNGLVKAVSKGECDISVVATGNVNVKTVCNIEVSDTSDVSNLDNSLLIGSSRFNNLNTYSILNNITKNIKIDSSIGSFEISKANGEKAIIVMLGVEDPYSNEITNMKSLIDKLKSNYSTERIFIIQELPVSINYSLENKTYLEFNNQIKVFNDEIKTYAQSLGIRVVNASNNLLENDVLSVRYSKDGVNLNISGSKLLWNNIQTQVLGYLNKKEEENPKEDNKEDNTNNDTLSTARQKIVARAKEIVKMANNKKAWYSQYNRTTDWNNKQIIRCSSETITVDRKKYTFDQPKWAIGKAYGFDCSSFVGVCYQNAGFNFMKGLSCAGGTLQSMAKKHNAKVWRYEDKGTKGAKIGDIVMFRSKYATITKTNMFTVDTTHTAIYMGDGYIAEAQGYNSGILIQKGRLSNKCFFMRIEELQESDNKNNNNTSNTTNCFDEKGTIDGHNYVYKFTNARITAYGGDSSSGCDIPLKLGKTCGSLNLPYNSKIYIPALKGRTIKDKNGKTSTSNGIFTVNDCGIGCTDIDIYCSTYSDSDAEKVFGNSLRETIYVLSWGSGYGTAWSYTTSYKYAYNNGILSNFKTAFKDYIKYNGTLINFTKFNSEDKDIRNTKYWEILNS